MTACELCGGEVAEGSTCPRAVECPTCEAAPGSPCKRPSGHRAAELHKARWTKAETRDALAGIVYEHHQEELWQPAQF